MNNIQMSEIKAQDVSWTSFGPAADNAVFNRLLSVKKKIAEQQQNLKDLDKFM